MKIKPRNNSGLAALGLLIFMTAITVIVGTLIYMLVRLCHRVLPTSPPESGTNQTYYVEQELIALPALVAEMPNLVAAPGEVVEWMTELQRTTNFVDWESVFVTNGIAAISFTCDPEPPQKMAFYRLHYFRK